MKRMEPETAEQIRVIMALCRSRGQDTVSTLDRAGFLRHKTSRNRDLINFLDTGIIPGVQNLKVPPGVRTPLDMKRVIVEALEGLRDGLEATK